MSRDNSKIEAADYIKKSVNTEYQSSAHWQSIGSIEYFSDNAIICAGNAYGNNDACQGESGGPLICIKDEKPILHGVVSWGVRCGERLLPGVYTRVATYAEWIKRETNVSFEDSSPRYPPRYTPQDSSVKTNLLNLICLLVL